MTGQHIPSLQPAPQPTVHVDQGPHAAARGILLWVAGNDNADPDDRITALEALGALEDHLPPDVILAAAPERPGTLQDAQRLLDEACGGDLIPRTLTGISIAQGHLRRRLEELDDAPGGGMR